MDHWIIMRVKILCKSKRCHDDKERRKRVQRVFFGSSKDHIHEWLGGCCWQERMSFINRCEEATEDMRIDSTGRAAQMTQEERSQTRCVSNRSRILSLQTPFHHFHTHLWCVSPPNPPCHLSPLNHRWDGALPTLGVISRCRATSHCPISIKTCLVPKQTRIE